MCFHVPVSLILPCRIEMLRSDGTTTRTLQARSSVITQLSKYVIHPVRFVVWTRTKYGEEKYVLILQQEVSR